MLNSASRANGTLLPCYPTPMCDRYTLTIDKSTTEKRFSGEFIDPKSRPKVARSGTSLPIWDI